MSMFRGALLLVVALALRAEDRVIVPGRTPLTSEIVERTRGRRDYAVDAGRSIYAAAGAGIEQILARDWSSEGNRRGTLAMYELAKKVESAPEDRKQKAHDAMQQELLRTLRATQGADNTRWLLAVYDQQHAAQTPVNLPANDSALGRTLIGKWRTTTVRATQYVNSYTGVAAPTNGLSVAYEFAPDGTYSMNGTMQVTSYHCTSVMYNEDRGHYRVQGTRLYIDPQTGINRYSNNCAPSSNREVPKTMGKREYELRLEPNSVGEQQLVMANPTSNGRPDYYKRDR